MTGSIEPAKLPSFDGAGVLARAGELLAGFEARSVVALLHAACSSPTARQAMASCSALLVSAWVSPPAGSRLATADDLAPLVGALRRDCPSLATVEDFLPLDPRFRVSFRTAFGREMRAFRVHPGGLESPLHVLQGIVDYAEALDPVLLPGLGFGLTDLLRVAGDMLDAEMSILAPAWSDRYVSLESPPSVTEAEVAAAGCYLDRWRSDEPPPAWLLESDGGCDRERLELAAQSVTWDSQRLSLDAGPHIGPTLFVKVREGVLPVPAALMIESLTAVVGAALGFLSRQRDVRASSPDRNEPLSESSEEDLRAGAEQAADAARRWRSRSGSDLELACRAMPATILFGYFGNSSDELLLIAPGHRHVVAVALVTGLRAPGNRWVI